MCVFFFAGCFAPIKDARGTARTNPPQFAPTHPNSPARVSWYCAPVEEMEGGVSEGREDTNRVAQLKCCWGGGGGQKFGWTWSSLTILEVVGPQRILGDHFLHILSSSFFGHYSCFSRGKRQPSRVLGMMGGAWRGSPKEEP